MSSFPGIQRILAPQVELVLYEERRTLQLLHVKNGLPQKVVVQRFSRNEWCVLIPVLRAYPGYVAHAELLAELTNTPRSQVEPHLEEARRVKILGQELRFVRDAISHADRKLIEFGFTIAPVHELGYTLALLQENP